MIEIRADAVEDSFGETIAGRGYDYYRRGRVIQVLKLGNTLIGTVGGSAPEPYSVEVDLSAMVSSCTCPYSRMCKHGAAVLYHLADNGEVIDGSAFMAGLRKKSKEELCKLLENLVLSNPFLIKEISLQKGGGKDVRYLVAEFGSRVALNRRFAAQQQEIKRLERAVTRNILGLPPGDEKAELIILFLEEVKGYFNDVDDSNGYLGDLVYGCVETLADDLNAVDEEKRERIIARLKRLEKEDEYGYFDDVSYALEGGDE